MAQDWVCPISLPRSVGQEQPWAPGLGNLGDGCQSTVAGALGPLCFLQLEVCKALPSGYHVPHPI